MWWPLTGMVRPDGVLYPGAAGRPAIDTGRFAFRAVPSDIETLNRRAAAGGDLDITAVSARAYADAADRYVVTSCGASFGDGYGPKLVVPAGSALKGVEDLRRDPPRVAVPGARTTAFLTLSLLMGRAFEFVEMPFDRIIGAVARGEVGAGLVIHEGQLTFADDGLRLVADVGQWWNAETGLPLPLGLNAVRRDLDARYGSGACGEVAALLRRSIDHAVQHHDRSIDYAQTFASANVGGAVVSRERVETFVGMYVNRWTIDMGDTGRRAIETLLSRGAAAGLCPRLASVDVI